MRAAQSVVLMQVRDRGVFLVCLVVIGVLLAGAGSTALAADRIRPIHLGEAFGEGAVSGPEVPHPTPEERLRIQAAIDRNIAALRAQGALPPPGLVPPLLGWPLAEAYGLMDPGYHGTSNFVDLNPAFPSQLLDYACGVRTYDLASGYNHAGIDIFNWPFTWNKMDAGEVAIAAAAPGTLLGKDDGHFDRSCGFNNNPWNAAYVIHADGSVAWYGHMKNGTVTAKSVGEPIAQGETLGIVGSSGSSTEPHLHFEVHDSIGQVIEPNSGACNPGTSWWAAQPPYFDSAINKLTAGFAAPIPFPPCPNPESPNTANNFAPGNRIYFTAYYRDQRNLAQDPAGATTQYAIYYPDGSLAASWSHSSPADHYAASYWYWSFIFPVGIDTGIYRFEAVYQGASYNQYFGVGGPFPSGSVPGQGATPLTVALEPNGDVTLTWDASCNAGDTDYAVYEGVLGQYYSHERRFCSTQGATTKTFTPAGGDTYYIVAPNNKVWEGSHGVDGTGAPRPAPVFGCLPRLIGACP